MNDLVEIFFDPAQSNIDQAQVTIDSCLGRCLFGYPVWHVDQAKNKLRIA